MSAADVQAERDRHASRSARAEEMCDAVRPGRFPCRGAWFEQECLESSAPRRPRQAAERAPQAVLELVAAPRGSRIRDAKRPNLSAGCAPTRVRGKRDRTPEP